MSLQLLNVTVSGDLLSTFNSTDAGIEYLLSLVVNITLPFGSIAFCLSQLNNCKAKNTNKNISKKSTIFLKTAL
jgi:hypothetical protein